MMHETSWKEYAEHGQTYRIRARYGVDEAFGRQHNQAPHFTLTADVERKSGSHWRDDAGGMMHEEIARHFPELAPMAKWHLCAVGEGPMHYVANAVYWWEHALGVRAFQYPYEWEKYGSPHEAALSHFKGTIAFGALSDDVLPHEGTMPNKVREWLEARLPRLLEAFTADMKKIGAL